MELINGVIEDFQAKGLGTKVKLEPEDDTKSASSAGVVPLMISPALQPFGKSVGQKGQPGPYTPQGGDPKVATPDGTKYKDILQLS